MSRKQKAKKGSGQKAKKGGKSPLFYITVILAVAAVGLIGLKYTGVWNEATFANEAEIAYLKRVKEAGLKETRLLMPASRYKGRVAIDYERAAKIPETLDAVYCYCRCQENPRFRHKTLLTCFVDDHAAGCEICLRQMEMAWDLAQQGKSPKEVRALEDEYFGRKI